MHAVFYTRQGPAEEVLTVAEQPTADRGARNVVLDVIADCAHR
jgi:hypothetical protein